MRSVADFYQDCMACADALPPLDVKLADAVSCVLAEDVQAPFNLPVVDLAACDGYAVRIRDCEGASLEGPVTLPVTEEIRAGAGDPAALVSLEFTDHGVAQVALRTSPAGGENIRRRAEDVAQGDTVLRSGTRIGARQMALLAGVGRDRVLVHPRPRVVIISIGDEIVEPGGEARPGTVFDANGHALATAVADAGAQTFRVAAVPDERARLRETIEDQLVRADLVLTTGGISYGSGDTVREVLGALGTVRFDNVAAWPGHIMGVGTVGGEDGRAGTPIVCLPGDPVSAQVCFEVFVRPALRHMQGWAGVNRPVVRAAVDRSWYSPRGRREFVRVRLTGTPRSGYSAAVMGTPASLLLSALADSNALAVVPEDVTNVRAGDTLQCLVLE